MLLPGTFLKSKDYKPSRPCVAVVHLSSEPPSCVEMIERHTKTGVEPGYHGVHDEVPSAGTSFTLWSLFQAIQKAILLGPLSTNARPTAHGKSLVKARATQPSQSLVSILL